IEQDLGQTSAELSKLRTGLEQLEQERKTREESLAKEKALHEKALAKQQELKQKHAELQVPAELRIKIRQANEAKQGLKHRQSKQAELEQEWKQQAEHLKQEQVKQQRLAQRAILLEESLGVHVSKANTMYYELKRLAEQ